MCARVREIVPLARMWCGILLGAKPTSGVVEIDRGILDQMSSTLGNDIIDDDANDPPI